MAWGPREPRNHQWPEQLQHSLVWNSSGESQLPSTETTTQSVPCCKETAWKEQTESCSSQWQEALLQTGVWVITPLIETYSSVIWKSELKIPFNLFVMQILCHYCIRHPPQKNSGLLGLADLCACPQNSGFPNNCVNEWGPVFCTEEHCIHFYNWWWRKYKNLKTRQKPSVHKRFCAPNREKTVSSSLWETVCNCKSITLQPAEQKKKKNLCFRKWCLLWAGKKYFNNRLWRT